MTARVGPEHGSRRGRQRLDVGGWKTEGGGQLLGTKGRRERAEHHSSGRPLRGRRVAMRGGSACLHMRASLETQKARDGGEEDDNVYRICTQTLIGQEGEGWFCIRREVQGDGAGGQERQERGEQREGWRPKMYQREVIDGARGRYC